MPTEKPKTKPGAPAFGVPADRSKAQRKEMTIRKGGTVTESAKAAAQEDRANAD